MPASSIAQQQAAGAALAAKKSGKGKSNLKGASKNMYDMSEKELEKIAGTKHKGLPSHVEERLREYIRKSIAEIITEDDTWIQNAVNPSHKGYCTPMSKKTCTPRRKALAKRFKKGIGNESKIYEVEDMNEPEEKEEVRIGKEIKNLANELIQMHQPEEQNENLMNESSFHRIHYNAIANILQFSDSIEEVADKLAELFKNDNPRFDRDKFLKASGF